MSVELAETGEGATPSNADLAYQIIRERLIMLDIRPSEPINDEGLARQLGFGRTPVREALKRLERDRLVIAYPRRGTFATTVDITDLAHIQEIRRQLEPVVAARAASSAPLETRVKLSELADEIAKLDPSDDPRTLLAVRRAGAHRDLQGVRQPVSGGRAGVPGRPRHPHLVPVPRPAVERRPSTSPNTSRCCGRSSTVMPTWRPSWPPNTSSGLNRRCARSSRTRRENRWRAGRRARNRGDDATPRRRRSTWR